MEFCNRLKDDRRLKQFYGKNFDGESLILLLRETLDLAFLEFPSPEARDKAETRVKLHHFRLVEEKGLSEPHYKLFREHFVAALRESWAEEELIEVAVKHMNSGIRNIFHSMDHVVQHDHEDDCCSFSGGGDDDDDEDDDDESVELASAPTSPDVVRQQKAVRRRRSSKDKLAAMFQSLAKMAHVTSGR